VAIVLQIDVVKSRRRREKRDVEEEEEEEEEEWMGNPPSREAVSPCCWGGAFTGVRRNRRPWDLQ
jgi:hypothetical protein